MASRTTTHSSFTLQKTFSAPVSEVYTAFADPKAKQRWFRGPEGAPTKHTMDFQEGGREQSTGRFHDGVEHRFEALYYDIVPNERIVYTYEMYLDGQRISVSLACIEFRKKDSSSELTLTEDGVFLDGLDSVESRKQGTEGLLNALAASL